MMSLVANGDCSRKPTYRLVCPSFCVTLLWTLKDLARRRSQPSVLHGANFFVFELEFNTGQTDRCTRRIVHFIGRPHNSADSFEMFCYAVGLRTLTGESKPSIRPTSICSTTRARKPKSVWMRFVASVKWSLVRSSWIVGLSWTSISVVDRTDSTSPRSDPDHLTLSVLSLPVNDKFCTERHNYQTPWSHMTKLCYYAVFRHKHSHD